MPPFGHHFTHISYHSQGPPTEQAFCSSLGNHCLVSHLSSVHEAIESGNWPRPERMYLPLVTSQREIDSTSSLCFICQPPDVHDRGLPYKAVHLPGILSSCIFPSIALHHVHGGASTVFSFSLAADSLAAPCCFIVFNQKDLLYQIRLTFRADSQVHPFAACRPLSAHG